MTSPRFRRFAAALAAAALGLGGCATDDEAVDVHAVAAVDSDGALPAEPRLAEGGWEEVAGWIAAEIDRSDRPVVIKFFASWCLPCRAEAPVLLDAVAAHPEIAFLGVAHEDSERGAAEFVDEFDLGAIPTVFDPLGETVRAVGGRVMPVTAFVNRDGLVEYAHNGPLDHDLLAEWIAYLTGAGARPEVTGSEAAG